MKKFHCFIILLFLSFSCITFPQVRSNNYRFAHIDSENGLSHGSVKCFFKDHRGILWVGTSNGLNRYDGNNVKAYTVKMGDFHAYNSNDILELFEDPIGNIWIKTTWGINIFDTKTEQFNKNQGKVLKKTGMPNFQIEKIVKDNSGNFWFIHKQQGISLYKVKTGKIVHLMATSHKNSIVSNTVSNLIQDLKGNIWVIHKNGILEKLSGNPLRVVYRNHTIAKELGLAANNYNLLVDSDNDLWIGTNGDFGVFYYNHATSTLKKIEKGIKPTRKSGNDFLRGMAEGPDGRIWVNSENEGICLINKKDFSTSYIHHNGELENSLSHNSILSLYKDNEGIIWVGTFKNGIDYYHREIFKFPYPQQKIYSEPYSLSTNDVAPFAEDEKGNLWVGTNGGGLLYYNRLTGRCTKYQHNAKNPNSISGDVIVSLLYDKNHHLWIGTYFKGLDKYDGKKFIHYMHDPKNSNSLSDNSVYKLFEDSKGRLWIGTLQGGINLFDRKTGNFYNSKSQSGSYPLHSNYVCEIAEDKDGNIWAGGGYGIDVFNPETGKSKHFLNDLSNISALSSNNVFSIFNDSSGRIWIGTAEGLNFYNAKDQNFKRITSKEGLPGKAIVSIEEDRGGNLWLASSNSLTKFSNPDLWLSSNAAPKLINYDKSDGLQGGVYSTNASLELSSGELVFGGTNGFTIFNPKELESGSHAPAVLLTGFELFNKPIGLKEKINGRVLLEQPVSDIKKVTLKYFENVFSITFTALNFINPKKNKFKYKLEGFEQEWNNTTNANRRITYTNLDPGDYELKIMASNDNGSWTTAPTILKISILPPFYRTPLAYAIYLMAFLSVIIGYVRYNSYKERMRYEIKIANMEKLKEKEISERQISMFTFVSHEFRTPLSLIINPLKNVIKRQNEKGDPIEELSVVDRNARRLLSLINQLLLYRRVEDDADRLSLTSVNMNLLCQEVYQCFTQQSREQNIQYSIDLPAHMIQITGDYEKIEISLFNLVSNAFKYTSSGGIIKIRLSETEPAVKIDVIDNGCGISESDSGHIFEKFRQVNLHQNPGKGFGIGLFIVKYFVEKHKGTVSFESTEKKGSIFSLSFRKGSGHFAGMPIRKSEAGMSELVKELTDEMPYEGKELYTPEFAESIDKRLGIEVISEKKSILIIDDNDDMRNYLVSLFAPLYIIYQADNGLDGLTLAKKYLPDVILSDIAMEGLTGFELCKTIKENEGLNHMLIVLLTASASQQAQLQGISEGADDYITKPFDDEILKAKVENLLRNRMQLRNYFLDNITLREHHHKVPSEYRDFLHRCIEVIEANLSDEHFTIKQFSQLMGMSHSVLYTKIKAISGQTLNGFIRSVRIRRAAVLMLTGDIQVSQAASQVGFEDKKYFREQFVKLFGMTPSQYIKKYRHSFNSTLNIIEK